MPDKSIYTLCEEIYAAAISQLSLATQAHHLPLRAILSATFDASHRPLVLDATPEAQRILTLLDADARACVFAQAIAGIVAVLRSAVRHGGRSVAAELRRFEDGAQRVAMLRAVETSPVWSDCFEKAQIGELILRAACEGEHEEEVQEEAVAAVRALTPEAVSKEAAKVDVVEIGPDVVNEPVFNDGPHLERNFGVPGVFSIMALN